MSPSGQEMAMRRPNNNAKAPSKPGIKRLASAHNAVMECHRRAMSDNKSVESRREKLKQANKLSRTWATLLEALDRHRGKGQQKVTVEHVHVHSGGQAVVGAVGYGGRGRSEKLEGQPHAKQIAHALQPALRSRDPEGDSVPVASDGKRTVPDARRRVPRRTERSRPCLQTRPIRRRGYRTASGIGAARGRHAGDHR